MSSLLMKIRRYESIKIQVSFFRLFFVRCGVLKWCILSLMSYVFYLNKCGDKNYSAKFNKDLIITTINYEKTTINEYWHGVC